MLGLVITSLFIACPAYCTISPQEAHAIGMQIWKNECAQKIEGLLTWRIGEDFASMGIGHFLWYPAGRKQQFKETFPQLIRFIKRSGTPIPKAIWCASQHGAPWNSKEKFDVRQDSSFSKQLRDFLVHTVGEQTQFMIRRLSDALPLILESSLPEQRHHIQAQFDRVSKTFGGWYPLVDYLNFKGEGLKEREQYAHAGWGLKQVLLNMTGTETGQVALDAFADAAAAVLRNRVVHAPAEKKPLEACWLKGWLNRIDTYRTSIL